LIEIRKLSPTDAEALWHLRLESLRAAPLAFGEHEEEHARMSVSAVAERLGAANSFVLGAFDGAALVGMAGFYRGDRRNRRHVGHIWGVYVQPAQRGQGLAKRLVQAIVAEARQMEGLEQILLSVTQPEARALYVSLGFESYGLLPRALVVNGQPVDEEFLRLTL
jgi:ribosomal protein S18 acetylase RimI-like enzyme